MTTKPHFKTQQAFISFLEETLIPDLRSSGNDETADDFEEAIYWMNKQSKGTRHD